MVVGDAHVFPDLLTPVLTSILSDRLLFSGASAEVRGGQKFCLNRVMSPTRSLLSHPGGARSAEIDNRRSGTDNRPLQTDKIYCDLYQITKFWTRTNPKHLQMTKLQPNDDSCVRQK